MSALVIAPDAALELLVGSTPHVSGGDRLMAPAVLRSHVSEALYGEVRRGTLDMADALARVDRLPTLGVRLLGDRVLQRTALRLAGELELKEWGHVEYLALAKLHGEALVTRDHDLAANSPVPVRWLDELR